MVSEIERRVIWEGWFSSEVCAGYFAELSGIYRRRQTVSTWTTLFFSSGAVAAAIGAMRGEYEMLVLLFAVLSAGVSLYSVVAHNHQRATDSADMQFRWARLANDYRSLWIDQHAEDATDRLRDLESRRDEISKSGAAFPNKQKHIRRWYERTKESLAYATSSAP